MPHKVPENLPAANSPNVTIRPSKRAAPCSTVRAEARMIRQKLLEVEQELEDRDALKSHPDDMRILHESFASVKTEFEPLDGQSWDTPEGRERLANHIVQQATRMRPNHLSPARARTSRLSSRRSRSSLRSSTGFSRGPSAVSRPDVSRTADIDLSSDDVATTLIRPTTPLPPDAEGKSSGDLERTPLPSFLKGSADRDWAMASVDDQDDDETVGDLTFYAEPATPKPMQAEDPKSLSTVRVPRRPDLSASPQKSPSRLPRPMRNLPTRGPILPARSPVFSRPESSVARTGSSSAPASALRSTSKSPIPTGRPSVRPKASPTKPRPILSSSQALNHGPVFSRPSGRSATRPAPPPGKRAAPTASTATTLSRAVVEPRSVKKLRPVAAETPSHPPVFFPRTQEPEPSSAKSSGLLQRHRTDTIKPYSSRPRTSSQSCGSQALPKAWK